MWLLKACPRCHGDLVFCVDRQSAYLECLQCCHVLSSAEEHMLGVRARRTGIAHHPAGRSRRREVGASQTRPHSKGAAHTPHATVTPARAGE
jgi:hypothetical protein